MNKFFRLNKLLGKYIIFASPLVIVMLVWSALVHPGNQAPTHRFSSVAVQILWDVLGIHLLVWLAVFLYLFIMLVLSATMREMLLTRLARIKERDEREDFIVGRAARASWLSTLALMMFMLIVSGLHISVSEFPKDEQKPGMRRSVSIGYGFSLFQKSAARKSSALKGHSLFSFSGTALSKSALLLVLMIWHLLSFHLFSRKWSKKC
jgi:hypothetical protein